jgi:hypothetical protein
MKAQLKRRNTARVGSITIDDANNDRRVLLHHLKIALIEIIATGPILGASMDVRHAHQPLLLQ